MGNCSTFELREKYLNKLNSLSGVHIDSETMIDSYIISGYTCSDGSYGVAIFEPTDEKKYKFQRNINSSENNLLITNTIINGVGYDLFWANKEDLDFAQIVYTTSSGIKEYKLDASDNKILYLQSPDKEYQISVVFATRNGIYYED